VDAAQAFDPHVNTYLNDHYFELAETKSSRRNRNHLPQVRFSLPAINVNRGRDHGLPGYNYYRALVGLNYARTFDGLWNVANDARSSMQSVYKHVNDVDLFTGGTSEFPVPGGAIGPTFASNNSTFFSL
jgi:peroxidase